MSECVDPAPAVTYAAPAPEDESSPALVAARQHVYDLADPEMENAVEHYLILELGRGTRRQDHRCSYRRHAWMLGPVSDACIRR